MKKLLLATMIGTALSASAFTEDFTYASEDVGFYGISQNTQTYDIAIFLPGNYFEGAKISAINVPMYTSAGIKNYSEPKVWLSSKLALKNGSNNADIASYDADLTSSGTYGNLGLTLPEEYTITDKGVYVGYSFTVTTIDAGTLYPIALSEGTDLNSCFVHTSAYLTSWTNVNFSDGLSSALTVTVTSDNLSSRNVSIVSLPEEGLARFGEECVIPLTLSTSASEPVNSIDFEYTFAGTQGSYHCDLATPVPATFIQTFDVDFKLPAYNEKTIGDLVLNIAKVNGGNNESQNATDTIPVAILSELPEHRVLFEEATCVKCGYCTRGYAALEYLKENYPEIICVSYHNTNQGADPMNMGYPDWWAGNPSAAINRTVEGIDPYYGNQIGNYELPVLGDLFAQQAINTAWDLSIEHAWSGDNLTANVTVKNVVGFSNKQYKIGYILVSDGLSSTSSSWRQTNYYNTEAPVYIPQLNDFCKGGIFGKSQVSGLVFNDVVISMDGNDGVANSIPTTMAVDEVVNHSFTWDVSKITSTLVPDKDKLRIVAFVLDSKGQVLNAAKLDLGENGGTDAVEDLEVENEDAPVEYYNLNGIKVANPQGGIFIRRQGSKSEKVVIK